MISKLSTKRNFIKKNFIKNIYNLNDSIFIFKKFNIFNFNSSLNLIIKLSNFLKNNFIYGKFYLPYNFIKSENLIFLSNFSDLFISYDLNISFYGLDNIFYNFIFINFSFKYIVINNFFFYYIFVLKDILFKFNSYYFYKNLNNNNFLNIYFNIKYGFNYFKSDRNKFINFFIGKLSYKFNYLKLNVLSFLNFLNSNKPNYIKNNFFNKIFLYQTMGFSLLIDKYF